MSLEIPDNDGALFAFNAVCAVADKRLFTVEATDYEHAAKRVFQLLDIEPELPQPQGVILVRVAHWSAPVPEEYFFDDAYFESARVPPALRANHH